MKPWLFAMLGGVRVKHTQTFTANATFTVPVAVGSMDITGKGQDGTPGVPAYDEPPITRYRQFTLTQYTYRRADGGPDVFSSNTVYGGLFDFPSGPPDPVSTSETSPMTGTYTSVTKFTLSGYQAESVPGPHHDAEAATTGASASAFGKTFPGGVGGPATTVTYNNVPVTRGATYNIVVPAGGSITITYYQ